MAIDYFCLLGDATNAEGWAPMTIDPASPSQHWIDGTPLAAAPVDVNATFDGAMWRSTKIDPAFNLIGVKLRGGFTMPRHHQSLRQLVIVFGGELRVEHGGDADAHGRAGPVLRDQRGDAVHADRRTRRCDVHRDLAGTGDEARDVLARPRLDRTMSSGSETAHMSEGHDRYDVIVVGSGGGLFGAYAAARRGLRTLVIEKSEFVGGTTAYSGAGIWLPGNPAEVRAGLEGGSEAARPYLDAIIGDDAPVALREAYLEAGPRMIEELEADPAIGEFEWRGVPDYFADAPGALRKGRTIFPANIERSELGDLEPLVRRPLWTERWGVEAPETMVGGQALIGRALLAFINTGNGEVRTNTALERLIVEDGRVVGVEAVSDGEPVRLFADRGVLLAAGGLREPTANSASSTSRR